MLKGAEPAYIITQAEQAGIGVLAVTDHNAVEWVDSLRAAVQDSSVSVTLGVEIPTPEGQILALFDVDHEADSIADLLVRVGIKKADHGREEAISSEHAEEVIGEICRQYDPNAIQRTLLNS